MNSESISELRRMMENNNVILEKVVQQTTRIRSQKAASTGPASIFEVSFDTQSRFFGDAGSTIAPTEFTFEQHLLNSRAYRRILAVPRKTSKDGESLQGSKTLGLTSLDPHQIPGTAFPCI